LKACGSLSLEQFARFFYNSPCFKVNSPVINRARKHVY
jgi:hypothetical protein